MQERFETFTVLINRISRNIKKIKNQEMSEYNLRSAHVSCLYYIYTLNDATATDLCEHCEEDKATISRALDYLDNKIAYDTIDFLEGLIKSLLDDVSDDYWEATEGNAKKAIYQLLIFARMRPDGIWEVS